MIDHWMFYARERGFTYEDARALARQRLGGRVQPAMSLFLGTLRGVMDDVPVVVRATMDHQRVRTRASGRAVFPVDVSVRVRPRKVHGAPASAKAGLPHIELGAAELDARFAVRANVAHVAADLLTTFLGDRLFALGERRDLSFTYESGQARVTWIDDAPADGASLDSAVDLIVAVCRWKPSPLGYR